MGGYSIMHHARVAQKLHRWRTPSYPCCMVEVRYYTFLASKDFATPAQMCINRGKIGSRMLHSALWFPWNAVTCLNTAGGNYQREFDRAVFPESHSSLFVSTAQARL